MVSSADRDPTPDGPRRPGMRAASAWTTGPLFAPAPPAASASLWCTLRAEPIAASQVRNRLRRWLDAQRWPPDDRDDLVSAASEAASNCIDHAYPPQQPGLIDISVHIHPAPAGNHQVTVNIRDYGTWLPRPAQDLHRGRGRGIDLMRAYAERLTIRTGAPGTVVTLHSRPARALPPQHP